MLSSVSTAERTNPWAFGTAALINAAVLALLLLMGLRTIVPRAPAPSNHTSIAIEDLPLFALHSAGGQGGGTNNPIEASRGHLPQIEKTPLAPPQIPILDHPKLSIRDAMTAPQNIKLPDDPSLADIGLLHSSNVTVISGGPGTRSGIGNGDNGGVGPGHGPSGFGPGDDNGIYTPGGDVTAPVPIFTPEAEFSDEARRQKFQGVCMISVIIDAHGNPQNPRVIRPLGMGLDEKALDAVNRYKFKPALKHGKPVASRIVVAVNFRLF